MYRDACSTYVFDDFVFVRRLQQASSVDDQGKDKDTSFRDDNVEVHTCSANSLVTFTCRFQQFPFAFLAYDYEINFFLSVAEFG